MTTEALDLQTSFVDPEVAAAVVIFNRMTPLRNALGVSDLSDGELSLFAMVAHSSGLDPFTRQIHAIKRDGKVTFQTGIDGYRSTAERTGQYAGSDEATFEACDCGQQPKDHPKVARVVVHRILPSGHVIDQTGIARWHELAPTGREAFMWTKMPLNQLAKCAEANGLRKAFPRVLGGVYIAEEMEQAGPGDNAPLVAAAGQPTAAERIAARRAALEAAQASVETGGEALFIEGSVTEPEPGEEPAPAPVSGDCGWSLKPKDSEGLIPCELGEMHAGDHSWHEQAVTSGGRVVPPAN